MIIFQLLLLGDRREPGICETVPQNLNLVEMSFCLFLLLSSYAYRLNIYEQSTE